MPHTCPKCGSDFPTPSKLTAHLNRKIPCDAGKYQCDECKHKFTTWAARHRHIQNNACKGRQVTVEQAQEEVARLQQELADTREANQQHLVQQIISNNITNNNLVVNIGNLHVHNSVGKENMSHLKNLTLSELGLQLKQDPSTLARWCKMVRADDEHPENHNVLLVGIDAKDAATCNDGKWKMQDREDTLLQLAGKDATSLYNLLARFGDEAREFRFDYLLHDVMAKAASLDKTALKAVMNAMAEPLVEMTQRLYAQPGENTSSDDSKSLAMEQLMKKFTESQREQAELLAQMMVMRQ